MEVGFLDGICEWGFSGEVSYRVGRDAEDLYGE
jgi:hypothetical protein